MVYLFTYKNGEWVYLYSAPKDMLVEVKQICELHNYDWIGW